MHLLSDLEACYNRQMPAIGGMVEGALGVNRRAINAIVTTVSTFKYFAGTGFGISKESHRGKCKKLIETRQGNIVSGAICRD